MAIFKLSTGLYEALYELQEMNQSLFNEMLRTDFKELEARKNGLISESAIKTLHEGVIDSIRKKISGIINWFISKLRKFWSLLIGFFKKKTEDNYIEKTIAWLKKETEKDHDIVYRYYYQNIIWPLECRTDSGMRNQEKLIEEFFNFDFVQLQKEESGNDKLERAVSRLQRELDLLNNASPIIGIPILVTLDRILEFYKRIKDDVAKWKKLSDQQEKKLVQLQNEYDKVVDKRRENPNDEELQDVYTRFRKFMTQVLIGYDLIKTFSTTMLAKTINVVKRMETAAQDYIKSKSESSIDRSYLLDFIDEMVEYDFNEAMDACYIDDLGHPVYAF